MSANLIGFYFRFSFWAFFDTQIMNFIWKYVFLVIQNLRSKFTTQRSLKYCFYFENSRSFKWVNSCKLWRMRLKEKDQSSQDYAWTTFWWLFKAGRQKQIPQISTRVKKKSSCLQHGQHLEFQTHVWAFCFCLDVSRPFASDTSPKWIDREGLGKRRTGTGQVSSHLEILQCI